MEIARRYSPIARPTIAGATAGLNRNRVLNTTSARPIGNTTFRRIFGFRIARTIM